ncbi:MAG: ATP:cob(I)alamin adenosyltransferase [Sedimenticola sp.]|jgi:cob(I)alamin adenosyltransferase|nr:MAG: ATP:cob(I)alamin adenosyltransferase [Sedimenticola sp.]
MGYRLSKIYTRTGDDGTTGLGDGRRVEKDSPRIEVIGCVDELNSLLGVLVAQQPPKQLADILTQVQHRLFDIGGELAMPGYQAITEESVTYLEQRLDELNAELPPLKEFILPGGSLQAASCHHARAVCRRTERRASHLAGIEGEEISAALLKYLNRLSDLLFVMARVLARSNGGSEVYWSKEK